MFQTHAVSGAPPPTDTSSQSSIREPSTRARPTWWPSRSFRSSSRCCVITPIDGFWVPSIRAGRRYPLARAELTLGGRVVMARRNESDVSDDLIRRYLKEIGKYELLTAADEVTLGMAIEAGLAAEAGLEAKGTPHSAAARPKLKGVANDGRDPKTQINQSHLRLVVFLAQRLPSPGPPLPELV